MKGRPSAKGDIIRGFPADAPFEDIEKAIRAAELGTVTREYVAKVRKRAAGGGGKAKAKAKRAGGGKAKRAAKTKAKAASKTAKTKRGSVRQPSAANGHANGRDPARESLMRLQAATELFEFAVRVLGTEACYQRLHVLRSADFEPVEKLDTIPV